MKHLLFICALSIAALSMPTFAQEDDIALQDSVAQFEESIEQGIHVKLDLDLDDEVDVDDKIESIISLVSKFDEEAGRELELELKGLSDEEKAELGDALNDGLRIDGDFDEFPIAVLFIAVPAVILFLGTPLFIVIALLAAGNRKRKQKMEIVEMYIKSDRDIPEHVITALDSGGSSSSLKSGLTLTAVGIGVVAAFNALGAEEVGGFGLIPMFLGIARLIFWFLVERKVERKVESESGSIVAPNL
ncbi:MAG: hypothetical protein JKX81_05535 [Arenicella sp.]|nr:hypothetical protein [Arenicella sp.]